MQYRAGCIVCVGQASSGSVHVSEYLKLHRGVELGEQISFRPVGDQHRTPHRLGALVRTRLEGRATDGQVRLCTAIRAWCSCNVNVQLVWSLEREGILIGEVVDEPLPAPQPKGPPIDARAGRAFVCAKQLTPELVLGYCNDFTGA